MNKDTISKEVAFYAQLDLSKATIQNYKAAFNSKFLKSVIQEQCNVSNIFEVTDLDVLWKIYTIINQHPINIANHRGHSAAINRYIRFLNNGQKYGKRVDFNKPRKKSDNATVNRR